MTPRFPLRRLIGISAAFTAFVGAPVPAATTLSAHVRSDGAPIANAVIHAYPSGEQQLSRPQRPEAVMDQKGREFVPHVLPVHKGTAVKFPNSDETRHHVYSFSEAKTFELRLYAGTPADPVIFDQTGAVSLGCNIHDWMLGYIFVVDTPAFAKTNEDGVARLHDLPPGPYELRLWHPRLRDGAQPDVRRITVGGDDTLEVKYALDLRPPLERQRGFDAGPEEEPLEDQF